MHSRAPHAPSRAPHALPRGRKPLPQRRVVWSWRWPDRILGPVTVVADAKATAGRTVNGQRFDREVAMSDREVV